jgi:hypothetical protein
MPFLVAAGSSNEIALPACAALSPAICSAAL